MTTGNPDDRQQGPGANPGSLDPANESNDPAELRELLARARERLSFYEGFDRMIADNVRRSGELMLETLSMRERVESGLRQQDHRELLARLDGLDGDLASIRGALDSFAGHIAGLRHLLEATTPAPVVDNTTPAIPPTGEPAPAVSTPAAVRTAPTWDAPRTIELVAHRVGNAATALSLQRYLGGLDAVAGVEAREFAEGVLRMQVTGHRPLAEAEVTGWPGNDVTVLQLEAQVVEIELSAPG